MTAMITTTILRYDDIVTVWSAVASMGARGWQVDLIKNGNTVAEDLDWDNISTHLQIMAVPCAAKVARALRRNRPSAHQLTE